jgi:hypothetical protein
MVWSRPTSPGHPPERRSSCPTLELDERDGGSNEKHVHDHADDCDDHVARPLVALEIALRRRQDSQQDREDRGREAD